MALVRTLLGSARSRLFVPVVASVSDNVCRSQFVRFLWGKQKDKSEGGDRIEKEVKKLLNDKIRPAIQADGGDITFMGIEDGVVLLRLEGACKGCPGATSTLKGGVERVLKHYIPEIVSVKSVE